LFTFIDPITVKFVSNVQYVVLPIQGDAMKDDNEMNFHAKEKDRPYKENESYNCEQTKQGGWWYTRSCSPSSSSLNGPWDNGVYWLDSVRLQFTEMKFRPYNM